MATSRSAKASRGDYFSYRSSQLKKAVQQALYLDPRSVEVDNFSATPSAPWRPPSRPPGRWRPSCRGRSPRLGDRQARAARATGAGVRQQGPHQDPEQRVPLEAASRFDHTFDLTGQTLATLGLGMLRARIRRACASSACRSCPPTFSISGSRSARSAPRHRHRGGHPPPQVGLLEQREGRREPIVIADADKLNRIIEDTPNSLLEIAVPVAGRGASVKAADNRVDGIYVFGTTADYSRISGVDYKEGRLFNDLEAEAGRSVCVLGFDVAEALFPGRSALGGTVTVDGHPLTVIGVFAKQGE